MNTAQNAYPTSHNIVFWFEWKYKLIYFFFYDFLFQENLSLSCVVK